MTWLLLGLVVALVLAWTTRTASTARPRAVGSGHASSATTPIPKPTHREQRVLPQRAARSGRKAPPASADRLLSRPASATLSSKAPETAPAPSSVPGRTAAALSKVGQARPRSAATVQRSGTLSFPADVATTYALPTASGEVVISGSWNAGGDLALELRCGQSEQHASGNSGAVVALSAPETSCQVMVSEAVGDAATVDYHLDITTRPEAAG